MAATLPSSHFAVTSICYILPQSAVHATCPSCFRPAGLSEPSSILCSLPAALVSLLLRQPLCSFSEPQRRRRTRIRFPSLQASTSTREAHAGLLQLQLRKSLLLSLAATTACIPSLLLPPPPCLPKSRTVRTLPTPHHRMPSAQSLSRPALSRRLPPHPEAPAPMPTPETRWAASCPLECPTPLACPPCLCSPCPAGRLPGPGAGASCGLKEPTLRKAQSPARA